MHIGGRRRIFVLLTDFCLIHPLRAAAVVEASCGHSHTVARTSDGKLFAWGRGDSGELGAGNLTDSPMPRAARSLEGHVWKQVAAGSYYTAALAEPGYGTKKPMGELLEAFKARTASLAEGRDAVVAALGAGAKAAAAAAAPAAAAASAVAAPEAAADSTELPAGWCVRACVRPCCFLCVSGVACCCGGVGVEYEWI